MPTSQHLSRSSPLCGRVIVFASALLLTTSAFAQTEDTSVRATNLFEQGQAAAKKKDWKEANRLYRESWNLKPSHDAAANVAHSAIKLGRIAEGASFFAYTLRYFPTSGDSGKRAAFTNYLELAKKKVTTVTVTVDPPTAEILVDGSRPVDAIFLDPGEHVIEARAPGYEAESETVLATAGAQRDIRFSLKQNLAPAALNAKAATPRAAAVPTPEPSPARASTSFDSPAQSSGRSIIPALIAGGVAAAGLGAGVAFTLSADSKESEADRIRNNIDPSGCTGLDAAPECSRLRDLTESENRHSTYSAIGFVFGGLGAAAVVGYLLWPENTPANAAPGNVTAVRPRPFVGRGFAGLVVQSGF